MFRSNMKNLKALVTFTLGGLMVCGPTGPVPAGAMKITAYTHTEHDAQNLSIVMNTSFDKLCEELTADNSKTFGDLTRNADKDRDDDLKSALSRAITTQGRSLASLHVKQRGFPCVWLREFEVNHMRNRYSPETLQCSNFNHRFNLVAAGYTGEEIAEATREIEREREEEQNLQMRKNAVKRSLGLVAGGAAVGAAVAGAPGAGVGAAVGCGAGLWRGFSRWRTATRSRTA